MRDPLLYPMVIAAPAQAFFHLVLMPFDDTYRLSFSVKDETNIRYYLIEGSNDMVLFDPISRIYAKGNSTLPRTYNATIRDTDYSYYRIRQIDSPNAALMSSDITTDTVDQRIGGTNEDYNREYNMRTGFTKVFIY